MIRTSDEEDYCAECGEFFEEGDPAIEIVYTDLTAQMTGDVSTYWVHNDTCFDSDTMAEA